jgi:hypothetical protein
MRRLLYVAALLVFLAGVQLFVFPLRTDRYFAWTIDSPMTAVFLGASYWSAVGLEVGAGRAARWSGARIAVPAVFVFTTVTLVVTLVHLESFHLDGDLPLTTRAVTWAWLAIYAVVPVLMVAATVSQRRESTGLLDDRASLRPLGITGVVFGVLQIVALARHGEELDWGSAPAAGYLAVLAVLSAVSAWSLLPSPLRRRQRGADTTTAQSRRPDKPGYRATDTQGHLEGDHRDAAVTDHMRERLN